MSRATWIVEWDVLADAASVLIGWVGSFMVIRTPIAAFSLQKGLDPGQLAMLQGVEYVECDPDHPEDALRGLTASLIKLADRIRQKEADQAAATARIDALILIGVVVLILVASSSSGNR